MLSRAQPRRPRRRTIIGLGFTVMLAVFPMTAVAQTRVAVTDTVTAIANAFFSAVVAARWAEASRLLDTTSLNHIRRQSAEYVKHWRAAPPLTLKQFMETNPDVPRDVAAMRVKEANERTRQLGKSLSPYGVEDPDSLLRLPIGSYAARWLEMRDERWQLRESARRCGDGVAPDAAIERYRVIASVSGDGVAYVLYDPGAGRSPMANADEARVPRVMVLRRRGSTWSIVPRDELIGLGEMVNACG